MPSRKIEDLDKRIQDKVRQLLNEFNSLNNGGWTAFITDGKRTQAEQNELYAQGRTAPGKIVTWTLKSNHISGLAVDIAFQRSGALSYDTMLYNKLVPIAKGLGFEWGGDWTVKDTPHFEITKFAAGTNMSDTREKLLDEAGIKDEPTLRDAIDWYKKKEQTQKDKLNAENEITQLKTSLGQSKTDLLTEQEANETFRKAMVEGKARLVSQLAQMLDCPDSGECVLAATVKIKEENDQLIAVKKELAVKDNKIVSLTLLLQEEKNQHGNMKLVCLGVEEKFKQFVATLRGVGVRGTTPEALVEALEKATVSPKMSLFDRVINYYRKNVTNFKK